MWATARDTARPAVSAALPVIRDLGLTLGEIWHLEELSRTCVDAGRYEFFVAAAPLNVTNASGSPLNPVVVW